jgi:hypothetical protein
MLAVDGITGSPRARHPNWKHGVSPTQSARAERGCHSFPHRLPAAVAVCYRITTPSNGFPSIGRRENPTPATTM